jgi:predicted nucleic acid-binding Zn ribbon protein
MARRIADEEWDDDAFDDDENDSPDDEPTAPCPYCNRPIHEDASRCPYCENYISAEDQPHARKPWFVILGTILLITIFFWWITHA